MSYPAALSADLDVVERLAAVEALSAAGSWGDTVHQLLAVVRAQLGMQVAWVSEFVGADQVLRFVDAAPEADAPPEGSRIPLSGTFCARVLDGRFPSLIADSRTVPEAALINATTQLQFGAYVGVPLMGAQGVAVGMLCAWHDTACPGLGERDLQAVRLLARLLHDLQQRAVSEAETERQQAEVRDVLTAVVEGRGRHAVLQPVVDLSTGRAVAAEGLTRFTAPSPVGPDDELVRSPAQWFDDAARLGLRTELELAAARAVLDLLDTRVPAGVRLTVNLGPEAILSGHLAALLAGRPVDRIVVELTEHAPVTDYEALADALRPYREAGLLLAIDDAGAGYASLRHVLTVRPDLVKVDMALVRGVDHDLARRTLLTALSGFADATGCQLVAEGVETVGELRALADCGVPLAQGYFLARPSTTPSWTGYPTV